jgi:hypothetical protein
MPYLSTEKIKEIRNEIKQTFPNFKFSIKREHYSTVCVSVLSGPIEFGTTEASVNHFWLRDNWGHNPQAYKFLSKLKSIMSRDMGEGYEDGDYGHIPNWYLDINIGKWDKPYIIKK